MNKIRETKTGYGTIKGSIIDYLEIENAPLN